MIILSQLHKGGTARLDFGEGNLKFDVIRAEENVK